MAEFIIFNRLYPIIQCNKHGKNIGDDAKGEENEREKLVRIYLYFFANRLSRCDDHSGEIDEKGCAVDFLTKPLKRVARISTRTRTLRSADAWRKLRSPPSHRPHPHPVSPRKTRASAPTWRFGYAFLSPIRTRFPEVSIAAIDWSLASHAARTSLCIGKSLDTRLEGGKNFFLLNDSFVNC